MSAIMRRSRFVPRALAGLALAVASSVGMATPIAVPGLSINDVSLVEGNAGSTAFIFTVALNDLAGLDGVTFDIATAPNTAQSGADFQGISLTGQSIAEGSSTYSFQVLVFGDTDIEPNETFFVNITNIVGAVPFDAQGQGTIVNDDRRAPPAVPEPATWLLTAGVGLAWAGGRRRAARSSARAL